MIFRVGPVKRNTLYIHPALDDIILKLCSKNDLFNPFMELHYVQFCMRRRRTFYLIHSKDKVLVGILKIFLFLNSLIGLSRAAIDLFQWDAPSDDVDDGRINSQVDFRSYWVLNHQFDGHLSLLITVPIQTLGSSTFFVNHPHFLWNDIASEKSPPKPP